MDKERSERSFIVVQSIARCKAIMEALNTNYQMYANVQIAHETKQIPAGTPMELCSKPHQTTSNLLRVCIGKRHRSDFALLANTHRTVKCVYILHVNCLLFGEHGFEVWFQEL